MNKWIILTLLLFQAVILFAANTVKINVTAPENIEAGKEFTISFGIYNRFCQAGNISAGWFQAGKN